MLDWINLVMVLLFLAWGGLCFWVGRRPQEAKTVAAQISAEVQAFAKQIEEKIREVAGHQATGADPLPSYADAADMLMSIGASGYKGQVELSTDHDPSKCKIVKSGTLPGVKYVTNTMGSVSRVT